MTDDSEVARIAEGLTKAQWQRLEALFELSQSGLSWASKWGSRRINTARATTSVLVGIGIIENDDGKAVLTPLGLAVRAYLQSKGGEA